MIFKNRDSSAPPMTRKVFNMSEKYFLLQARSSFRSFVEDFRPLSWESEGLVPRTGGEGGRIPPSLRSLDDKQRKHEHKQGE